MARGLGLLLAAVLAGGVVVATPQMATAAIAPVARIATPTVPQDDVVLLTHDVADYGADPTGVNDNTAAFQQALNDAHDAGGGIVYAKAGAYRFTGHLVLPRHVTLRGEWANPDGPTTPHYQGTVLMPYADRGQLQGTPFLGIGPSAGVKNLNIWYPEQVPTDIKAYPYTIADVEEDGDFGGTSTSVKNVTMFNSYQGIHTGAAPVNPNRPASVGNVPSVQVEPRIRSVYGTFLYQGIQISQVGNYAATSNFYSSSKYWIESGLAGAPTTSTTKNAVQSFMRNNATGLITSGGLSDGVYYYNINIEDAQLGIDGQSRWQAFAKIKMKNVVNGITIRDAGNSNQQQIIDADITTLPKQSTGDNWAIGITTSSVIDVIGAKISGNATHSIYAAPGSRPSISQSTFSGWTDAAVSANGATLQLLDSKFLAAGTHVRLGASISSASILGNTWTGSRTIANASNASPSIDDTPLALPQLPALSYETIPERLPSNPGFSVNIVSKGARTDLSDNTGQIQAALNDAGNAGGGTVIVPAGQWRIAGGLTVPSGVQLRGVNESPSFGDNRGSWLSPTGGRNQANGTPAVTLNGNSGFVGISFYYPDVPTQDIFTPYPYSIRAAGADVYIRDVVFANSWQGVDLFTNRNDRFAVSGIWGDPRDVGIRVGGGSVGGKIENTLFAFTGNEPRNQALAFPGQGWKFPEGQNPSFDQLTVRFPIIMGNSTGTTGLQNQSFKQVIAVNTNTGFGPGGAHVTFVDDGGSATGVTLIQTQSDVGTGFEGQSGSAQATFVGLGTTHAGNATKSAFSGRIDVFGMNVGDSASDSPYLPNYSLLRNQGGSIYLVGGTSTNMSDSGNFYLQKGLTYIAGFSISNPVALRTDTSPGAPVVGGLIVDSTVTAVRVVGSGARGNATTPIPSTGYTGPNLVVQQNVVYP